MNKYPETINMHYTCNGLPWLFNLIVFTVLPVSERISMVPPWAFRILWEMEGSSPGPWGLLWVGEMSRHTSRTAALRQTLEGACFGSRINPGC
jgi:hypothetical protein